MNTGSAAYCRWLTGRAGSHFSLSFLFLPRPKREGMEAVYAFCRAIDDAVDRDGVSEPEARRELALWRAELHACDQGFPAHPITVALRDLRRRCEIPLAFFEQLVDGMEMDLHPAWFRTFEELKVYCRRVASAVGLISVRVFGCRSAAADQYADRLGIAFQLTNILRDLKADLERGRLYLPLEDLERFGITEAQLHDRLSAAGPAACGYSRRPSSVFGLRARRRDLPPASPAADRPFLQLMGFECRRAREYFHAAEEAAHDSGEARLLFPARVMAAVYSEILREIERDPAEVLNRRMRIARWKQLLIILSFVLSPSKHEPVHPSTSSG